MTFSQMLGFIRMMNPDKIVFIKSGAFYIAVAQDAVFLNKLLSLKTTCHKNNVCKVGVPLNSLKKYLKWKHIKKAENKKDTEMKLYYLI